MAGKKTKAANSSTAWIEQVLNTLAHDANTWRDKKEEELYQAEEQRQAQLARAYQARLDKAFRSKKSKDLMISSLEFFIENYNGQKYVRFEGTVFTAEEFKERVNYLFRQHVENLWSAQLKIEAEEEAKQLELNSAIELTMAAFKAKKVVGADPTLKRSEGKKNTAKKSRK